MNQEFYTQELSHGYGFQNLVDRLKTLGVITTDTVDKLDLKGIVLVHNDKARIAFFEVAFPVRQSTTRVSVLAGSYTPFFGASKYIPLFVPTDEVRLPTISQKERYFKLSGI